jgi:1-aminocyclopropane-1-carboxylate deaminase
VREVAVEEATLGLFFDHVVVCTVTGSTHAGMIAGVAMEDRDNRRVIGVDASKTLDKTVAQVTSIARATAAAIGVTRELRDDEITVLDGYAALCQTPAVVIVPQVPESEFHRLGHHRLLF